MISAKTKDISGAILAGGANKRFGGKIKANETVGGSKIIDSIVKTLSQVFDEIILVTNTPLEFNQLVSLKITGDQYKGAGPLGGIHAAMKASEADAVFIFASDMPFLCKDLIIKQIELFKTIESQVLLPEINGRIEPLHGIYRNALLPMLDEFLQSGTDYAIRDFLSTTDLTRFDPGQSDKVLRAFTNINTPADAAKAMDIAEQI
jgi:molybdopterin-guanine dinucleotide biosynthesis protein A